MNVSVMFCDIRARPAQYPLPTTPSKLDPDPPINLPRSLAPPVSSHYHFDKFCTTSESTMRLHLTILLILVLASTISASKCWSGGKVMYNASYYCCVGVWLRKDCKAVTNSRIFNHAKCCMEHQMISDCSKISLKPPKA
jgi:hypothetical protein